MFELWQAQCADDDGIFDLSTARNHPFSGGVLLQEYAALGEIAFIEAKGEVVKQAIQDNPMDFIERVGNRFMAAFVYYMPFNQLDEYNRPWPLFLKRLVCSASTDHCMSSYFWHPSLYLRKSPPQSPSGS